MSPTVPTDRRRAVPSQRVVTWMAVAIAVLFITTVLFGLMAFLPSAAPIKSSPTRAAVHATVEEEITTVARRFTASLITFDYRSIDSDLARTAKDATQNYRTQFHTALGGDLNVFRRSIEQKQATSSGDVKGTSVSSHDDNTASVLVFVSQTIRSNTHPGPQTQLRLLELTLVRTKQGWRVDNVGNPARS